MLCGCCLCKSHTSIYTGVLEGCCAASQQSVLAVQPWNPALLKGLASCLSKSSPQSLCHCHCQSLAQPTLFCAAAMATLSQHQRSTSCFATSSYIARSCQQRLSWPHPCHGQPLPQAMPAFTAATIQAAASPAHITLEPQSTASELASHRCERGNPGCHGQSSPHTGLQRP